MDRFPALYRKIALLLFLILTALLVSGFLAQSPEPAQLSAPTEPLPSDPLPTEPMQTAPTETQVPCITLSTQSLPEAPIHILLIGQDRREGEARARADTIVLCSAFPEENRLVLTSFLRDLYVSIPGHGNHRLNSAYAWGGSELLMQTLEKNFGIAADGCIEVDFSQFAQLIDQLGGVTLELESPEARVINKSLGTDLTEGMQLLTGQEALAYSRIRCLDGDGDLSRSGRQRKVLLAVLKAYRSAGLMDLLTLLPKVAPMISTDLNQKELTAMAIQLFPLLSDPGICSQRIPQDGAFSYGTVEGMEVLIPDLNKCRTFLENCLRS